MKTVTPEIIAGLRDIPDDGKPCRLAEATSTGLAMTDERRETYRVVFAGIVQGGCDACGAYGDDACPCDRIVDELVAAVERIASGPET